MFYAGEGEEWEKRILRVKIMCLDTLGLGDSAWCAVFILFS